MWLNVPPAIINGVKLGEESNLPSGVEPEPEVTVCGCESLLVHVTVSPTWALIGLGAKALSVLLDEPGVMSAVTVAANAGVSVDSGASNAATTAASPTATAILELIGYRQDFKP